MNGEKLKNIMEILKRVDYLKLIVQICGLGIGVIGIISSLILGKSLINYGLFSCLIVFTISFTTKELDWSKFDLSKHDLMKLHLLRNLNVRKQPYK